MSLLRFRLKFDDYDDVHRDIDIKSDQTFAELLQCILQAIGFDNVHEATFFMADHNWRKSSEIGVIKPNEAGKLHKLEIVDQIDDPHQKFLFEYDKQKQWQFTLELIKILPLADLKTQYPLVYSSGGIAPVQYVETIVIPVREKPKKIKHDDDDEDIFIEDPLADEIEADETDHDAESKSDEVEVADIAELPADFEIESDDDLEKLKDEMSGNIIETADEDGSDDTDFGMDDEYSNDEEDDYGSYGSRNDYDE